MSKKLLIAMLLAISSSSYSYADTASFNSVCSLKEPNQIEMIECASERYDRYDRELNIVYQNKIKILQKNEANKLRISQRKWISKKEASCNTYTEEENGSNGRLESSECFIQMTKERIEFLRGYK
jgi:uncharacterized protein YecT (DUF1311 family)